MLLRHAGQLLPVALVGFQIKGPVTCHPLGHPINGPAAVAHQGIGHDQVQHDVNSAVASKIPNVTIGKLYAQATELAIIPSVTTPTPNRWGKSCGRTDRCWGTPGSGTTGPPQRRREAPRSPDGNAGRESPSPRARHPAAQADRTAGRKT